MKCIVVIGIYNEAENIPSLLPDILHLGPQYEAIVVDDNSPDGTGHLVSQIAVNNPRIRLVERPARLGYGSPYLEGFRTALDLGGDYIIQMDAGYSHNPRDIPRLVETVEEAGFTATQAMEVPNGSDAWASGRASNRMTPLSTLFTVEGTRV